MSTKDKLSSQQKEFVKKQESYWKINCTFVVNCPMTKKSFLRDERTGNNSKKQNPGSINDL